MIGVQSDAEDGGLEFVGQHHAGLHGGDPGQRRLRADVLEQGCRRCVDGDGYTPIHGPRSEGGRRRGEGLADERVVGNVKGLQSIEPFGLRVAQIGG